MSELFVARPAPSRILLLILGSLAFVALGLWLAGAFGQEHGFGGALIGWVSILFFGACGLAGAHQLLDRKDQIVIGPSGVYWRRWSPEAIPWSAIAAIEPRSMHGQRFLCIFLEEPTLYPSSTLLGRLAKLNKGMGFGDIAINALGTDRSFHELYEAFRRFIPVERQR